MNVVNGIPGLCCFPLVRYFSQRPKITGWRFQAGAKKASRGTSKNAPKRFFDALSDRPHVLNTLWTRLPNTNISLSHTHAHTHKYVHSLSHSHCLLVFIFLAWWRCFFVFICGILGWKGSQGCTWASSFYNPSLSLPFFTLSQSLFLCHAFSWDF